MRMLRRKITIRLRNTGAQHNIIESGYSHLREGLESGPLDELGGESAAHIIVRVLAKDVHQVGLPAVAGAEGVPHLLEADGLRLVVLVVVQVRDEREGGVRIL